MSNVPLFPNGITSSSLSGCVIGSGQAVANQTLYTSPSNGGGSRIDHMSVANSLGSTKILMLIKAKNGGQNINIGAVTVPASAGINGSVATYYPFKTTMFGFQTTGLPLGLPTDSNGQPYIQLAPGESLIGRVTVAMSAGSSLFIDLHAIDF